MELNDLLHREGIDPRGVLVFRHRPSEPELNRIFPELAAGRPDLFDAYQRTHSERIEKAMLAAKHVAAFIRHGSGKALFVACYEIGKAKSLTQAQYWRVPAYVELRGLGMRGFTSGRPTCLSFQMKKMNFYSEWKGKLIIDWPPPERSWWRRAHRNQFRIHAILEDSALETTMQNWNEIDLTWAQLSVLSNRLQHRLTEWRGIYYIFDSSDAKGYVGSAYGTENLLGRWRQYGASGHGGNSLLRRRDPTNFRFTILELVSPTMPAEEVQRLEGNWKARLHSRYPLGLNDN
ncbi:MAG: GIY-YIG nuclease family protein [Bradyrhizobium sp.]|uniref:GIY-YIG nuclease family protein n=1 Tax=Bradyrhizobium sp. TaxID=376 RepID=UPI0029BD7D8B|nr:GIY-YIG nuclease family protein [Bradyrhizobium sp.]MDX3970146.1 GIY-YIG nuclease family protein [Bradyrhizobium sp.]